MPLQSKYHAPIKTNDWKAAQTYLFDALEQHQSVINSLGTSVGANVNGPAPTPSKIAQLSVLGGAGTYDVQITDNQPVNNAIEYLIEYSENPSFVPSHVVSNGSSRNARLALNLPALYFKAYHRYVGGASSTPVFSPQVAAGGTTPPPMQAGTGAGAN